MPDCIFAEGEYMKWIRFSLMGLLAFSLASCEECSDEFKASYAEAQGAYKDAYESKGSTSSIANLRSKLTSFLSSHKDVECQLDDETINPTDEVSVLLKEIEVKEELLPKVIYGDDNRVDVVDSNNPRFKELAKATAAQVSIQEMDEFFNILSPSLGKKLSLCSGERFYEQPVAARCSGFLIAPDLLLTAGHCVQNDSDCSMNRWVFDYLKGVSQFDKNKVYRCDEIVSTVLEPGTGLDYAVIRLDRPVTDRKFLRVRSSGAVKNNDPLLVIGHPSGLPTKISDGAKVRSSENPVYFVTNLDTFGGNSGSAVLNAQTGITEGILVRGETDYKVIDGPDGERCRVVNTCSNDGCGGEEVTKITRVDGIPLISEKADLFKGLFVHKNYYTRDDQLPFKVLGYDFNGESLAGRSFLGICGLHVLNKEGGWINQLVANCKDENRFSSVFDTFYDRIFY